MKLMEPWYVKIWKFFFQSAEDYEKELQGCLKAQRRDSQVQDYIKRKKRKRRRIRNIK